MPTKLYVFLEEVNTTLSGLSYGGSATFYKLAYLQPKDDKTFPMVRKSTSEATQISPYDVRSAIFYHRIIEEVTETADAKGNSVAMFKIYNMRLVCLGTRRLLSSDPDEVNPDLAVEAEVILLGKRQLSDKSTLSVTGSNSDKIDIFETEFSGHDFNSRSLDITAYTIDYNIKQRIVCL